MESAIFGFSVVFIFFFGSLILQRAIMFGFDLADKALENSGKLVKLPFVVTFKILAFSAKFIFKRLKTNRLDEVSLRPIYDITPKPMQLQAQGNHRFIAQDNNRIPVIIEHP